MSTSPLRSTYALTPVRSFQHPADQPWLLAALFFVVPTTIAPAYWLLLAILLLWLIEEILRASGRRARQSGVLDLGRTWCFAGAAWTRTWTTASPWSIARYSSCLPSAAHRGHRASLALPRQLPAGRDPVRAARLLQLAARCRPCPPASGWTRPAGHCAVRGSHPVHAGAGNGGYVAGHEAVFGSGRRRLLCAVSLCSRSRIWSVRRTRTAAPSLMGLLTLQRSRAARCCTVGAVA